MKDRIRVRLRGFDVRLIDDSARGIVQTVQKAGAKVSGPIPLPTRINKYTVLRSPHVHKISREQFEMRTHKRLIDIIDPTPDVMDALMKLELPQASTWRSSSKVDALEASRRLCRCGLSCKRSAGFWRFRAKSEPMRSTLGVAE